MKKIKELKAEVSELRKVRYDKMDYEAGESLRKKNGKRVSLLNKCIMYLETDPTEEFVKKQIKETFSTIQHLNEGFADWKNGSEDMKSLTDPEARRIFSSETGLAKLKMQLKVLKFILN